MDIQTLTHITPDAEHEELWLALQQNGSIKKSKKIGELTSSVSELAMDVILGQNSRVSDIIKLLFLLEVDIGDFENQFKRKMLDPDLSQEMLSMNINGLQNLLGNFAGKGILTDPKQYLSEEQLEKLRKGTTDNNLLRTRYKGKSIANIGYEDIFIALCHATAHAKIETLMLNFFPKK